MKDDPLKDQSAKDALAEEGPASKRFLFIDQDRKAHFDADAKARLEAANDASWVTPEKGVLRVPAERWRLAQAYERGTWMEDGAHAHEDRNAGHAEGFAGYATLKGRRFERAIELGCGPFTNLRLIAQVCDVAAATLLDPLLGDYLRHRHCTYTHGLLRTGDTLRMERWGKSFVGRGLRKILRPLAPRLFHTGVPVVEMLPIAIEAMPPRPPFDLVVIINVLEHCYDAEAIFQRILSLTRPGSVLVFHDKLYDAREVVQHAAERFDAGHPLRIDEQVLRRDLLARFRPMHEAVGEHVEDYHGIDLTERVVYHIGERR